jgi:hypothetical protein
MNLYTIHRREPSPHVQNQLKLAYNGRTAPATEAALSHQQPLGFSLASLSMAQNQHTAENVPD